MNIHNVTNHFSYQLMTYMCSVVHIIAKKKQEYVLSCTCVIVVRKKRKKIFLLFCTGLSINLYPQDNFVYEAREEDAFNYILYSLHNLKC